LALPSASIVLEERMTADFSSDDAERSKETRDAGKDDAFTRPEKEMPATKNAIGGLSDQIADAASDIGAVAQEQAKQGLKYARGYAGGDLDSAVAAAPDRVGAVASAAQSKASSIGGSIGDVAGERPLPTLALAQARIPGRLDLAAIARGRSIPTGCG
jgi:hypothetical protein